MDTSSFSFEHRSLIKAAADFLVDHQSKDGDFHPPSSRCGYNEIYDAKGMFTVLQAAYMVRNKASLVERYLTCLDRRLALFARSQLPDGSLPLECMGHPGWVAVTGAVAVVVKLLEELTGDHKHHAMAQRCLDYIVGVFTPENGFRTPTNANDLNFHDQFPLYALFLWRQERADAAALVEPGTEYVVNGNIWNPKGRYWKSSFGTQKGFDREGFPHPTLDLDRAWVLFEMYSQRYADQIHQSIIAIQENFEAIESYYTEHGTRYAETRTRTALAGVMATFDHYTGSQTFTRSTRFEELQTWALDQFDEIEKGFRERENLTTGDREFFGAPAQYLSQYLFSCGHLNRDVSYEILDSEATR